jgi:predicted nucleic acid-binding Zn ribbon protein
VIASGNRRESGLARRAELSQAGLQLRTTCRRSLLHFCGECRAPVANLTAQRFAGGWSEQEGDGTADHSADHSTQNKTESFSHNVISFHAKLSIPLYSASMNYVRTRNKKVETLWSLSVNLIENESACNCHTAGFVE